MDYKKMWYELKKYLIEEDLSGVILQMDKQEIEEVLRVEEEFVKEEFVKRVEKLENTVEQCENIRIAKELEL